MTFPASRLFDAPVPLPGETSPIIGDAPALRRSVALARRFATSGLSILLIGETGTGKELFAQAIHHWAGRSGALIDVDCGALPNAMMESLLFGHRRGAFTGALSASVGLLTQADRGTLFLDEVTSLSPEAQAKLLRVLETREVRPLGSAQKHRVDLQVVAAAQEDLAEGVEAGSFRRDLHQRLAGVVIQIPPLRERMEDLLPLADHFAKRARRTLGLGVGRLLARHRWPANVRELRLAIERAACLTDRPVLEAEIVAESIALGGGEQAGRPEPSNAAELRRELVPHLIAAGWNVTLAAAQMGTSRATLYRRLQSIGLQPRSFLGEQRRRSGPNALELVPGGGAPSHETS